MNVFEQAKAKEIQWGYAESVLIDGENVFVTPIGQKAAKMAFDGVGKGGSVIYADGMLYCYSEDGIVGLVRPSPEKCQVVSTFKVPQGDGAHWAHPVVSNGRLFIRHGDVLMCYKISAE